jgi:hypothetical protein
MISLVMAIILFIRNDGKFIIVLALSTIELSMELFILFGY